MLSLYLHWVWDLLPAMVLVQTAAFTLRLFARPTPPTSEECLRYVWGALICTVLAAWVAPAALALTRSGYDGLNVAAVGAVAVLYACRLVARGLGGAVRRLYQRRHPEAEAMPRTAPVELPAMPDSLKKDLRFAPWLN